MSHQSSPQYTRSIVESPLSRPEEPGDYVRRHEIRSRRWLPSRRLFTIRQVAPAAGAEATPGKGKPGVHKMPFGKTADGTPVDLYVLTNGKGMTAKVMTYGAIITELDVPDKSGKTADVVLGFDDLKGYLGDHPYFGSNVGRVGNRIAKGKFTLDGKEYTLATNNGPNHLHGGNLLVRFARLKTNGRIRIVLVDKALEKDQAAFDDLCFEFLVNMGGISIRGVEPRQHLAGTA